MKTSKYSHIQLPGATMAMLHGRTKETDREGTREKLKAIGLAICKKKADAIAARRESGCEEVWLKAEEAYIGMDNANRAQYKNQGWAKPQTPDGPLTRETPQEGEEPRSTVFFRMTARYTDMAAAKEAELLIPTDDKPFSLKPTPLQDEELAKDNEKQIMHRGMALERDATPEEAAALSGQPAPPVNPINPMAVPASPLPHPPGSGPAMPLTVADVAEEADARAITKAKKAEKRIEDWMVEENFPGQMSRSLFDGAKLGVAVIKGPFPKLKKKMKVVKLKEGRGYQATYVEKIVPGYERKSPWCIYPARGCGENIADGEYLFEVDRFTESALRELADQPDYIPEQIAKVLEEGPNKKYTDNKNPNQPKEDDRYEVWFYYGILKKEDYIAIDSLVKREKPAKYTDLKDTLFCQVTLVNEDVIKAVVYPLDSGRIPYHNFSWTIREGHWWGIGIPEQIDTPQRMCNGALRAMLDNAGLSAGVNIVLDTHLIEPADGQYVIGKNKLWIAKVGGAAPEDVRKAVQFFQVPSTQEQLDRIIERSFQLAEQCVNIPLISQGFSGKTQPETLGGMQLQDNNANQLLRDTARRYDDYITEPIVQDSYEWLLGDPEVPEDEKGDYQIHAHGSQSIVNRAIQRQILQGLFPIAGPQYDVNPRKLMKIHLKANQITPSDVAYEPEELQKIDSQPPPAPYQIEVAKIRAQVDEMKAKLDKDRDTVYVQAETARTQAENDARMKELELERQIAEAEHQVKMETLKVKLAEVTMKLQVQQKLAAQKAAAETTEPPTEPPGRAPNGESFQR